MAAPGPKSRSNALAVTDFPLPDSPRSTSVRPASTEKVTPRTTRSALRLPRNSTVRPATSSTAPWSDPEGSARSAALRVKVMPLPPNG